VIGVALLGGLGAWLRGELTTLGRRRGWRAGRATFVVNVVGAAAFGLAVGAWGMTAVPQSLATGFLAGFTTFSTWMVESVEGDIRTGDLRIRVGHVAAMVLVGIGAAAAGRWLGAAP